MTPTDQRADVTEQIVWVWALMWRDPELVTDPEAARVLELCGSLERAQQEAGVHAARDRHYAALDWEEQSPSCSVATLPSGERYIAIRYELRHGPSV